LNNEALGGLIAENNFLIASPLKYPPKNNPPTEMAAPRINPIGKGKIIKATKPAKMGNTSFAMRVCMDSFPAS
jgi:hypothetical protein